MTSLSLCAILLLLACDVYGQSDGFLGDFSKNLGSLQRFLVRCQNQQLRNKRGQILSPGYPRSLQPHACYQWSIFVNAGQTLTLTFRNFSVSRRPDTSCTQGVLEIGPVPHRSYCLNDKKDYIPPIYESTHSLVWIKLVTGQYGAENPFILEYIIAPVPQRYCESGLKQCASGKCLPAEWFCNGIQECGVNDNSDETRCNPPTPKPTPAQLVNNCGPGRFPCISRLEHEVTCFEPYQRCDGIVHCLNAEDERRCDARTLHCGGYTELQSGYITSPNFPLAYPSDKTCDWNIHVPAGRIIQIRFQAFDLSPENPITGTTDYVEFRDGRGRHARLLGRYTEQRRPPTVIETTGDWLYVKFRTDLARDSGATGFNFTHQIKGVCLYGQEKCRDEEDCFVSNPEKCDGIWHCRKHGWDERGCANCDYDKFSCGSGGRCYPEQEHCNGRGTCFDNRDEKNCTPDQCNSGNGTYLCLNGRCIYESWVCDGTNDCEDDSDEKDCVATPSIRVILAAVVGSLICGLLLVIALGCTLHMFAIRIQDQNAHYDTPMSRIQAELMRRAAPPSYNEAMQTTVPFTEMLTHMRAAGRRLSRGWRAPEIPTGPLNVAPLIPQTGTRIPNTTTTNTDNSGSVVVTVSSSSSSSNSNAGQVTSSTNDAVQSGNVTADTENDVTRRQGDDVTRRPGDDVTGILARPGFEEGAQTEPAPRPSVSSDSDVSLLELTNASDSSSLLTADQSQVDSRDEALLLANEEVANEVHV